MKRQSVINIIPLDGSTPEVIGNLKKACLNHGWSYNTLSRKILPIEYKGFKIYRVQFQ